MKMGFMEREALIFEFKNIALDMNKEIDAVVVEGKKDMLALRKIGFTKKILYPNLAGLENEEVVCVLTDFDSEGRKIHRRTMERLNGRAKINNYFRRKFYQLLSIYGGRDIESINGLLG